MRSLTGVLVLVVTCAVAVGAAVERAEPSQPTFRSTVELVVVRVNVADARQQTIPELTKDDFVVVENGAPQHVTHFLNTSGPLDVALVLDASSSMASLLPTLRSSALEFLDGLAPHDRAMVVGFDQRTRVFATLTDDRDKGRAAVKSLRMAGSTSLYDGLYITLKSIASASTDLERRQAIIMLSDGQDTSSMMGAQEVYSASIRLGIPIYSIIFRSDVSALRSREEIFKENQRLYQVKELSRDTGGRTFRISDAQSLEHAYGAISRDLAQQYVLGYVSTGARHDEGQAPQIQVRIPSHPGALTRTHVGYVTRPWFGN